MVKTTLARLYTPDNKKLNRIAKRQKTTTAEVIKRLLKSVR